MKFSPISITPDQERSTTPDVFIVDQYGKLPALHGDGPLTINHAIRLSKIINGYAPGFTSGEINKIIWGFDIDSDHVSINSNGDLTVRINPGAGIINSMVFRIPIILDAVWKNFTASIPPQLPEGRLILYFKYDDLVINFEDRPLPQNFTRKPMVEYPMDQSGFNPIKICHAFYDPNKNDIVNSEWDSGSNNIIISSNITYKKDGAGKVEIWVEDGEIGPIFIGGQEHWMEGGGLKDLLEIDGGELSALDLGEEVQKDYFGIKLLANFETTNTSLSVELLENPTTSDIIIFYNGVRYVKDIDWELEGSNNIYFYQNFFSPKRRIFAYENINSTYGNMVKKYYGVMNSAVSNITISGLVPTKKYLVFKNGILEMDDYTITTNNLKITANYGDWIEVYEINEGRSMTIIYNGKAPNSTTLKIEGLDINRGYLVFYNGLFYGEGTDYRLLPSQFIMTTPMSSNKNLLIIGV